jgi:ABC-type multidrug transport system fused ATPase/permease subunit
MSRFKDVNDTSMEKLLKDMQLGVVAQLITTLISYLSYFIVLVCATWLVIRGDFTAGMFFIAIGMIDQLSYPLISLAGIIRQLVAIKPSCASMEQFLDASSEIEEGNALKTMQKNICFRDVTFAYDEQKPILQNFDFTVDKGNRYLIKGPSGCGKTTTINLLLRYYTISSGKIEVDGISINNFCSTYDLMTVVRQDAILFNDTLRNNLTMYQDISDSKLFDILRQLGLGYFANKDALDNVVIEGGANLSGGEKKRICLARALLRDTDILIFDEPLANLDNETAGKIEDLLISIKDKTLLIVSHQFSNEKLSEFDQVLNLAEN